MNESNAIFSDKAPSLFSFEAKENELFVHHPKTRETFAYFLYPEQSAFSIETRAEKKIVQVFLDLGNERAEITQTDILRSAAKAYHLWKHFSQANHPFIFKELKSTSFS
jgi:hypothetical protein